MRWGEEGGPAARPLRKWGGRFFAGLVVDCFWGWGRGNWVTQTLLLRKELHGCAPSAFKRSRVNFENLAYLTLKEPGTSVGGEVAPAGVFVGLGARLANTQLDLGQGPLEATNRQLDLGIQGQGFFKVKIQDTIGNG